MKLPLCQTLTYGVLSCPIRSLTTPKAAMLEKPRIGTSTRQAPAFQLSLFTWQILSDAVLDLINQPIHL